MFKLPIIVNNLLMLSVNTIFYIQSIFKNIIQTLLLIKSNILTSIFELKKYMKYVFYICYKISNYYFVLE